MRVTTLMKNILANNQDKKVSIYLGGKQYELKNAFVTDDTLGENGEVLTYGRVILCAGEPIMEKKPESL